MPLFKDAADVYATIGALFQELAADDELGPQFRKADTIIRYAFTEPEAEITVRLEEGAPGDVDLGESEMEPEVTLRMTADTAHEFWLGDLNVPMAMARGKVKTEGPLGKVMNLLPLLKPANARYREILEGQGRTDLLGAV